MNERSLVNLIFQPNQKTDIYNISNTQLIFVVVVVILIKRLNDLIVSFNSIIRSSSKIRKKKANLI